jgi:hypothetical protein
MKIEEELQHSKELAPHFAKYREEAPLLSTSEVERLLASRAMLPNPSRNIIRNSIMTLAGLTGIGAIAYLAFFSTPQTNNVTHGAHVSRGTNRSYRSDPTDSSHQTFASTQTPREANQKLTKPTERGPWSAGNDQFYADLTREELAGLGIVVEGDTVFSYKLNIADKVERFKLTARSIGGGGAVDGAPAGVRSPTFYAVLMTHDNGKGAAYRIEAGSNRQWGMVSADDQTNEVRAWLLNPPQPGYRTIGFATSTTTKAACKDCKETIHSDSVKITVGQNLPPAPFPLSRPDIDGYSDTVKNALMALAHYYEGSGPKPPAIDWPKTLTVTVDTMTAKFMLEEMDKEANGGVIQRLHSIMARLNELVPVIVRMTPGSGKPSSQDFIFWYEPSDELFNALPPAQASVFRAKLAAPPHCFTGPNGVLTKAEMSYCVSEPQKVHITVYDLTGKERIYWDDYAVAGDNIAHFGTETLASGMYIVAVREANGTERTRRIWVENAHPKKPGWQYEDMKPDSSHSFSSWVSYDDDSVRDDGQRAILNIPCLELDPMSLAQVGIKSNDSLAGFYQAQGSEGSVGLLQLLRKWDPKTRIFRQNFVQVGGTRQEFLKDSNVSGVIIPRYQPLLVTNAIGRKRIYTSNARILNPGDAPSVVVQKYRDIDQKFKEIDQLIPILLRADHSSDSVGARDLIFWYQPTPEFLAALPDSARAVAQSMIGQSGSASVHSAQGMIEKVEAYPNPSKGGLTLKITLGTARTLTLTMRNLLGQQVAPPMVVQAEGASEHKLNFNSLGEGVYILDVTSDAGEEYLQRLVIVR